MDSFLAKSKRSKEVSRGISEFGYDFYMVDPRKSPVIAAPFHIENKDDVDLFVDAANPDIPWIASQYPGLPKRVQ